MKKRFSGCRVILFPPSRFPTFRFVLCFVLWKQEIFFFSANSLFGCQYQRKKNIHIYVAYATACTH